jgi:hypothetical protein
MSNYGCFYVYIHVRIEPSNAFRLVLKVAKYTADVEYGLVEMADQEHELCLDRSIGYSLAQFHDDVATKIIWGLARHCQFGFWKVILALNGKLEGMINGSK